MNADIILSVFICGFRYKNQPAYRSSMNYLAHLFLSDRTPASLIGNLLGDFVKGSAVNLYPDAIRSGIDLHRKVDRYTDCHVIVRSSKSLVCSQRRRFAGVLIDMFYDHFLAKNWLEYSEVPLPDFARGVYQVLQDSRDILPESLQQIVPTIIARDLLCSYREIGGIDIALNRMSARIKWTNNLADGIEDLTVNYQQLESDFRAFFPDLINYAATCKNQYQKYQH
ncbi:MULTISPECIES: ACP phosphodiesterase [unclassified Microcoleus]|uniref:acyl carrier protein phosphodiesterase n=1 Tax=unclassified Microcoleus TaxID=2642155 RepID=UPI0025FEC399|nr:MULTISPECIES: ACP phosphodiesterase [unclassified Microcoleus]